MTPIEICNIALAELEMPAISSFDEGTEASMACASVFFTTARLVLRSHPWSCARRRALLSHLGDSPQWGFSYRYQLPSAALWVAVMDYDRAPDPYERLGDYIETDDPGPLRILYTADLTRDETTLVQITGGAQMTIDVLTGEAIAYRLAGRLAKRLTGSGSARDQLSRLYDVAVIRAKSIDATETVPIVYEDSSWEYPE